MPIDAGLASKGHLRHTLNTPCLHIQHAGARMIGSMTRVTRPMATPPHASANGAFIDTTVRSKGSSSGPLAGLTFGAKDLFDVRSLTRSTHHFLHPHPRSKPLSLATATLPGLPRTRQPRPMLQLCR